MKRLEHRIAFLFTMVAATGMATTAVAQPRRERPARPQPPDRRRPRPRGPVIKGMKPVSGPVGARVIIRGRQLDGATKVMVGKQAAEFRARPGNVRFKIPAGVKPGPRMVRIVFPDQPPVVAGKFVVEGPAAEPPPPPPPPPPAKAAPVIDKMEPTQGGAGTRVVLHGKNLAAAAKVLVGKTSVDFKARPGRIVFTLPKGIAPGPALVRIRFPDAPPLRPGSFTVEGPAAAPPPPPPPPPPPEPLPTVRRMMPPGGPLGSRVVIRGNHLEQAVRVLMGGRRVSFEAYPRRIVFNVPRDLPAGPHEIGVKFRGKPPVVAGRFTIDRPVASISGMHPAAGGPGTRVVIRGANLDRTRKVRIDGRDVPFRSFPNQVVVTVPDLPPGPRPIVVVLEDQPPIKAGRFSVDAPRPLISVMDPPVGVAGTRVVIRGHNLDSAQMVRIGRQDVPFKAGHERIKFSIPENLRPGPHPVFVRFDRGRPVPAGKIEIEVPLPRIGSLEPRGGGPGTRVVLRGVNLEDAVKVRMGGEDVPFQAFHRQLEFVVPDTVVPGERRIKVRFREGRPIVAGTFVVDAPRPRVSFIRPPAGGPGQRVVIRGDNLQDVEKVKIARVSVPFKASERRIVFTVPLEAEPGLRRIRIRFPGQRPMLAGEFVIDSERAVAAPLDDLPPPEPRRRWRYDDRPAVAGFGPKRGPAGTTVVVRGRNFPRGTLVVYGGETITPINLGPRRVVFKVPRGVGIASVGLQFPGWDGDIPVGEFDVSRRTLSRAEINRIREERRRRAARRWEERRREEGLLKLADDERRQRYLRIMADRERTRDDRRRRRLERLRARWEANFLASPDVLAEMRIHAERKARLKRMLWIAEMDQLEKLIVRIEVLVEREDERHSRRMTLLKDNFSRTAGTTR